MHGPISPSTPAGLPTQPGRLPLHRYWSAGWRCGSEIRFAFGVSLVWLAFYNLRFWDDTVAAMWHGNASSVLFMASLFAVASSVQTLLLLLFPRRLLLPAVSLFFLIAAASSYFSGKYGVVMNQEMLRNVFETDPAESRGLLNAGLLVHLVVLGLVPAWLVWKVRLPQMSRLRRLRERVIAIAALLAVCGIALLSASASYAVFFREYKPIRFLLAPVAPVTSAVGVLLDKGQGPRGPLINAVGVTVRAGRATSGKPLVIVMIVGETARAANFQLGGYGRATNPELSATPGVIYYPAATSCATATAISVPCMFSHLPRQNFDVDEAAGQTNLLDALQDAGLTVEWYDNNAGCKGVCARVPTVQYPTGPGLHCDESGCHDEILVDTLTGRLTAVDRDTVIVMHQMGSHGPAYAERYPRQFARFQPDCRSNQLQHCTPEEVVNAYDNTIAYTDHVLSLAIRALTRQSDRVDSLLVYASDHGESLGEQNLYLHGLPYAFAPETQKRIPLLLWMSQGYASRHRISRHCLVEHAAATVSHDNLYSTLLGATGSRNAGYSAALDLLTPCRASVSAS